MIARWQRARQALTVRRLDSLDGEIWRLPPGSSLLMEEVVIAVGHHDRFAWLVTTDSFDSIAELTLQHHPNLRLGITSFDSAPLRPGPEEIGAGWTTSGKVMVSPPLAAGLDIPCDGYDEWYLFEQPPPPDWDPEVFVNYGGFTLESVADIHQRYDATWDRHGLEWLVPIQARFWAQLEAVNPVSYVATGDRDVIVSRRRQFIDQLRA